jgi:hypothetical protein
VKPGEEERAKQKEETKMVERAIVGDKPKRVERTIELKKARRDALSALVDASIAIEKIRVSVQIRQSHLRKQNKADPETEDLCCRLRELEDYVNERIAHLIENHPAYPWFSLVKGVGRENIAKVIGLIDINRAPTISSLWMFAGFAPDDGKAMKRVKGQKLQYNSQLRSMAWRLANSLRIAKGKFYDYYIREKGNYTERFIGQGYKVLPTPGGRWACLNCGANWAKKRDITPCCTNPEIEKRTREEPSGVLWLGHLDAMALRKMTKLFLACLWLVWREAENLPTRDPYPIGRQGHTSLISPFEMIDREPKERERSEKAYSLVGR